MAWRRLTRAPWEALCAHLPQPKAAPRGGRPRVDDRRCREGIRWTGAPWSALPRRYGSPSTCWRRLKHWEETGGLLTLWRAFLAQLNDQQKLRWDECVAEGSFVPAKKGAQGRHDQAGQGHEVDGSGRWRGSSVGSRPWTRRPRRRSPPSSRPSPRSRPGGRANPGDPGSGPSG
jgi:transposase